MRQVLRKTWWLLCMSTALIGCSSSDDALVESPPADASASDAAVPVGQPAVTTAADTPELAEGQPAADAVAEFAPPFPGRDELFEPPKRAQSQVRHDDEHGATVELKGFINVDEPKVVLSIDGVISPVPEGGEKYGVQVIAIEPPSVVLQRGRSRWTATLE
jgi:hypothetical protein